MMMSHVVSGNGSTLKNIPPKLTINTWPTKMMAAISRNPRQPRRWSADRPVAKARALNMFQNCNMTKTVKKTVGK